MSSAQAAPSRTAVRNLLNSILVSGAEFEAFLIDFYPEIYQYQASNMDRVTLTNLLISKIDISEIIANLKKAAPQKYDQNRGALRNETQGSRNMQSLLVQQDKLITEKETLIKCKKSTNEVDRKLLALRRQIRKGPQLYEGEILSQRYTLMQTIGRGGFATVWQAFDRKRKQLVAVKVLHSHLVTDLLQNEEGNHRFSRGERIMANLQHENIVRVFSEPTEEDGFHYFIMEYIDGYDLARAIIDKKITTDQSIKSILQVGAALSYAHRQGLIHRDVKPQNILLDKSTKHAKLTDFDLVWGPQTTGGTNTGAMGTFLYAAPEQQINAGSVDQRADIYSLGMTLLFAVYKQSLPTYVIKQESSFIFQLDCSEELREIITRAVAWEPQNRYQSIDEFCKVLSDCRCNTTLPSQRSASIVGESITDNDTFKIKTNKPSNTFRKVSALIVSFIGFLSVALYELFFDKPLIRRQLVSTEEFRVAGAGEVFKNLHIPIEVSTLYETMAQIKPSKLNQSKNHTLPEIDKIKFVQINSEELLQQHAKFISEMVHIPSGKLNGKTINDFYIDKTEVTVKAYKECVVVQKCPIPRNQSKCNYGIESKLEHPINCINFYDAALYCKWAGKRLSTQSEREYLSVLVSSQLYAWGDNNPSPNQVCWSLHGTCPAGNRQSDHLVVTSGLISEKIMDLFGNVREWTAFDADKCISQKYVECKDLTDRPTYGASWSIRGVSPTVSSVLMEPPQNANSAIGFRCAR